MILDRLDYNLGTYVTAFSTRRGGVNTLDSYSSFNACDYTGDSHAHIADCRRSILSLPGIVKAIYPRQTHSTNVVTIADDAYIPDANDTDALVTNRPGVALCINTADCVPVLMADPVARVIAAAHSGWRGTVGHIAVKALDAMIALGARPENVSVVMGPSICADCFEVGDEVANLFGKEWPTHAGDIISRLGSKAHIDLRRAICIDLESRGVPPSAIDTSSAPCSMHNDKEWFSARRLGTLSGRTLSLIHLIP